MSPVLIDISGHRPGHGRHAANAATHRIRHPDWLALGCLIAAFAIYTFWLVTHS